MRQRACDVERVCWWVNNEAVASGKIAADVDAVEALGRARDLSSTHPKASEFPDERRRATTAMPKQRADENGMKGGRSKKSDKARRTHELNGSYSQKHLRLREEQALKQASRPPNAKIKQ